MLAVVCMVLTYPGVEESSDPQAKKLDIMSIVTLSVEVLGLIYYITQGADIGFLARQPSALP